MIHYRTPAEIELIRKSALLVGDAIASACALIKPGITSMQLNDQVENYILKHGAVPSFKNYKSYPYATCISVNDAVVHGFPTNNTLKEGDVVSIDAGVYLNGYHGDSAYTFLLKGNASDSVQQLLKITKESLYLGIQKAVHGNRVGDISYAIQYFTEKENGYGVVRELVGHGIGRNLHEDPQVPNFGKRGTGSKLKEGMVIAIEPMINLGTKDVYHDKDGWTVRTSDNQPSAHFEHTVAIQKNKADILSSFLAIEAAEKANDYLEAIH